MLSPTTALKVVTAAAWFTWLVALIETRPRWAAGWGAVAALAIAAVWLMPSVKQLAMTPYKGLQALLTPGTRIIDEMSSPLGLITVVESADVPFRYAPGMSLSAIAEIPPQHGVFSDGDGFSPITRYTGDAAELDYLDALTSALPYHLMERPRTLIVGAGGDAILQAIGGGAIEVDVVDINPQRNALLKTRHADFFGWPALSGRVHLIGADLRAWLLVRESPYDLIVIPLDESSVASGAGVRGLLEDYLFTREAFSLYWSCLTARGALAVTPVGQASATRRVRLREHGSRRSDGERCR